MFTLLQLCLHVEHELVPCTPVSIKCVLSCQTISYDAFASVRLVLGSTRIHQSVWRHRNRDKESGPFPSKPRVRLGREQAE